MPPAVADKKLDVSIYVGEDILSEERAVYEFKWHHLWSRVTQNKSGTTGWATILQSTNESNPAKNICRIHVCAHNPCIAVWDASKYGDKPPPYHVELKKLTFAAVAESLAAQSSFSSAAPPDVVPAEKETKPENEQGPLSSSEVMPQVEASPAPTSNALKGLLPAAPTSPIHLPLFNKTAVAGGADEATAALCRVRSTLLSLARDIRRPGQYVGYSAFVLMGLLMKCRPSVWEGSSHIDLLQTFAPWAKEDCVNECQAAAIACALTTRDAGKVELVAISEQYPLQTCKHFVAGAKILPVESAVAGPCVAVNFETMYAYLGVAVMPSVLDGDCAFDTMLMMLGQASNRESRTKLRQDISDYLLERVGELWIHDIMLATQELDPGDVDKAKLCNSKLSLDAPEAPSTAVADKGDKAVEDAMVLVDAATVDEETIAAMRWASKLTEDANVLNLIHSLPKAVIEEQVILYRKHNTQLAVAEPKTTPAKIRVGPRAKLAERHKVAARYHKAKQENAANSDRIAYGGLKKNIEENIQWT